MFVTKSKGAWEFTCQIKIHNHIVYLRTFSHINVLFLPATDNCLTWVLSIILIIITIISPLFKYLCFTPKSSQITDIFTMLLHLSDLHPLVIHLYCAAVKLYRHGLWVVTEGQYILSESSPGTHPVPAQQRSTLCCGTRAAYRNKTQQRGLRDTVRVKQLSGLQAADKQVSWVWADDADCLSVTMSQNSPFSSCSLAKCHRNNYIILYIIVFLRWGHISLYFILLTCLCLMPLKQSHNGKCKY